MSGMRCLEAFSPEGRGPYLFDPATMVTGAGAAFSAATGLTGGQASAIALTGAGAGIGALGTLAGGNAAYQAGLMKKAALDQEATSAVAIAQRQSLDTRLRTQQLENTVTAKAAGSGLAATGESTVANIGQVASRGAYQAAGEMAAGQQRAENLEYEGDVAEYEGKVGKTTSEFSAAGTLASGLGSAMNMYGGFTNPKLGLGNK
jgi:hypothetical protein